MKTKLTKQEQKFVMASLAIGLSVKAICAAADSAEGNFFGGSNISDFFDECSEEQLEIIFEFAKTLNE